MFYQQHLVAQAPKIHFIDYLNLNIWDISKFMQKPNVWFPLTTKRLTKRSTFVTWILIHLSFFPKILWQN